MKNQSIILKSVLALGAVVSLAGCGETDESTDSQSEANNSDDQSLTILVEGGSPALDVANQTKDEFEEMTGYEIIIDSVPYAGVYDKLNAEISAGQATLDVAIIDVLWFPALAKGLEPLDNVLSQEQIDDFLPRLEDSATFNDELLGLPTWTNSKILLYRTDLFEDEQNKENFLSEYGYELDVPTNWEEYYDAAEFFTREGMYGASVFGQNGGDAVSSWLDHASQAGANGLILDEDNNIVITDDPYVESLEYLQSLVENEVVPEDYLAIASSETAELFNGGDLAMQLAWGHFYLSSEEALPGQVGAAPMISGSAGVGAVPGPWYQVILKDSDKKDIASEYLEFMYEKNELYMDSLGVAGRNTVFDNYSDSEEFKHISAIQSTLEGEQTQNRPQIDQWSQIENEILSPMLQNVLSGADAKTELENAEAQIDELLNR